MNIKRIAVVVNPIAGMGGKVGLKGTDNVIDEAIKKGATPVAPGRAALALSAVHKMAKARAKYDNPIKVEWLTCKGHMGEDSFKEAKIPKKDYKIVYTAKDPKDTSAEDTRAAVKEFLKQKADLVVFVGGDGTARDVYSILKGNSLMLGIPSGVKMHSGVFCINPEIAARILEMFIDNEISTTDVEIMDLDEERYRKGEWNIKLFGYARSPFEPSYVQGGKQVIRENEEDVLEDIAWYISELMKDEPVTMWILGAGGTLLEIGKQLKIDKSLLGIDVVINGQLISKDVDEHKLLELLQKHHQAKLVVSPIGAQGFFLGRGNLQLSPKVLKMIGMDNILVVATPAKLNRTPALRVDTGDPELDKAFSDRKHMFVIAGDHFKVLHPIGTSTQIDEHPSS
jgi:predicted polyphosphate/ATP-dependent NAD kinase